MTPYPSLCPLGRWIPSFTLRIARLSPSLRAVVYAQLFQRLHSDPMMEKNRKIWGCCEVAKAFLHRLTEGKDQRKGMPVQFPFLCLGGCGSKNPGWVSGDLRKKTCGYFPVWHDSSFYGFSFLLNLEKVTMPHEENTLISGMKSPLKQGIETPNI